MRKSLFALENVDTLVDGVEMDISPEEGEAADVLNDVSEDGNDIAEMAEAVSEGSEAAGQMEEVEALVEDVAENGEGLDPVAAEAIRISVEAICARVGANPKAVYSLYATENFTSASSRKANTRIALEGVGEFLKDLYAKIKAALSKMWEKVKAFWAKHVSTLGRVKKALDSMKTKVASSTGKFKDRADIEQAPGAMVDAFPGKGTISAASIMKFVEAHVTMTTTVGEVVSKISDVNAKATESAASKSIESVEALVKTIDSGLAKKKLGTSDAPMVGGVYISYEVDVSDAKEGVVSITQDRQVIDDKESKVTLVMADKGALKNLLDKTVGVINETIKIKDKSAKSEESVKKMMDALGKAINDITTGDNADDVKVLRNVMKAAHQYNAKVAGVNVEILSQNIRLAKGVLGFAALSLKNYKAAA